MAIQNAKWFDMNAYLNNKLAQVGSAYTMDSLVQALNAAGFVGEQGYYNHFMQYGHTEDVSPSAGFSASQYYIFKAASYYHSGDVSAVTDAEAATIKQLIKDAGMDAWTHYQKYGTVEQINASNTFDTAAYLQAKADAMNASSPAPAVPWTAATIATAIQDAGMSAYEHFMNYKGVGPGEVASTDTYAVDPSKQAANAGQTFTLTINQDTLTGTAGNDTFAAGSAQDGAGNLINTLQNVDSLDGGAGTDTLSATLSQTAVVAPSLKNIENVNVRVTDAGASLSLAGATGVTAVTVENSTVTTTAATGTVSSVGAANLAVKNQNTGVSFDGSTATSLGLTLDTVGAATATGHVAIDLGLTAAAKATTLNITANNANADVTATTAGAVTTVNIAATGANQLQLADAKTTATAINVTGTGSVDFVTNGGTLTAVKTLTVADGGVTIDATGGVLETATTGAGKDTITVVGTNVKKISTGTGDDKVSTVSSALAATSVVDLGAGDDTLTLSAASTAGATLTGGDGTDTLAVAYAGYNTISGYGATDRAKITGFEVLSITTAALADTNTVDLSKIDGITSAKVLGVATTKGASITNIGANGSVELVGADTDNGDLTGSLKTDTSADSLTLVLNRNFTDNNNTTSTALAAATQKVILADVEALTVKSTGTNTSLPFTPVDGYKADTITNTLDLTGSNKLAGITVTGDQKLVLASTAAMTKLATVDGSANTGGLDFDGSLADMTTPTTSVAMTIKGSATAANTLVGTGHADTITGGAKADTITGGKGGDTLTGNGGNDKFVFAAGDSAIGTDTFDTITDFVANTWGNGTGGAAGTEADLTDATKVTGDVLSFTVAGTAAAGKGIKVFVASSAADATTFLANTASADNTQSSAALDSTTNKLYVDVSGDGVTDFYISLTGVTTLDAAAFDIN